MVIKFYGFFNERIGQSVAEFKVDGEITLTEFLRRLVERFPIFRDYVTAEKDWDTLNSIFFVARKGTLLKSRDIINDDDELAIMMPLEGG